LWRAAITSDQFFAQIKLGSWKEKLRKMILAQDPGNENDFSGEGNLTTPPTF
jgi:hypothetical protein